jgi:hypothetical protein
MRVVALLAVRNEEAYLARSLEHLYSQGIETCLIDNGSTDRTVEIANQFSDRGVFRIEHLAFNGYYEWESILALKEKLAAEIDADWFIHHDADEIHEAPLPYRTLLEGFIDADAQGYNAISFDEFVFLPTCDDGSFEGKDYVQEMRYYYYFFEPRSLRRLRAWKKQNGPVRLAPTGGHQILFPGRKVFPVPFIMRHYVVLSHAHALRKYAGRIYSAKEISERHWHGLRATFRPDRLAFPDKSRLKPLSDDHTWDTSDPWPHHEFLGRQPARREALKKVIKAIMSRMSWHQPTLIDNATSRALAPAPIIVGASRSGTTLLRLMLDAHPELAIPPETHFHRVFSLRFNRMSYLLGTPWLTPILRYCFYRTITTAHTWGDFHLSSIVFRQKLRGISPFTIAEGCRCFYRMYAQRFEKPRWGDKTPNYLTKLHRIQQVLPEAHFIHVIQDGRDVALSKQGLWFGPGTSIEAQAADWMWCVREARQQAQRCPHYLEVRYEDIVTDTERALKTVCEFIALPYHEDMLKYHETACTRIDEQAGWRHPDGRVWVEKEQFHELHQLTRLPPQASGVGRWRIEMSKQDRDRYESIAGLMLRDLGYETSQLS